MRALEGGADASPHRADRAGRAGRDGTRIAPGAAAEDALRDAFDPRAGDARRGRGREPDQGRVPGDAVARAALAARRDPHLGHLAALGPRRRSGPDAGLEAIERNTRHQAKLIEDLLDVSRIISGKMRLDVGTLDLADVVNGALEGVRHAAEAKSIELEVVVPEEVVGPVSGDTARLQQVVWNLLSNAVKFTPRDGRIVARVDRVDSHAEVQVTDSGRGIDPAFLPHIFERFRQADSSTTRSDGGLGLGLAIVRHLVELHGGTVAAESDGVGRGSTFRVRLPLRAVRMPLAPVAPARVLRPPPVPSPLPD